MPSSQLGTADATLGDNLTYGFPPSFGRSVVVTAFSTITLSQSLADAVLIYGNYTPTPSPFIRFQQDTGVEIIYALGMIDRLLLEAVTIDITEDTERSVVRYLERQNSKGFPANGQPLSAIQQIGAFTGNAPTGGTWDLIFTMQDGSLVTVTNAFDDTVTEFQTNVDTEMAGEILGYASGDIAITDSSGNIRVGFSGDSVKYLHWENVSTDVSSLTGTDVGDFGAITVVQYGHPARYGWSALYSLRVVNTLPTTQMGVLPNSFDVNSPGSRADYPPQWVVRALAEEMSYVEGNPELKAQLFRELGIS